MRINIRNESSISLLFETKKHTAIGITNRLYENRNLIGQNPLSFLAVLLEDHGLSCEVKRKRLDNHVAYIEQQTGMTSLDSFVFSNIEPKFDVLLKALHGCNTELIFLDNIMNFELALSRFVRETIEKFEELHQDKDLDCDRRCATYNILQNVDYLINACEMRRYQAQSLLRRVQSQINVVS